MSHTIELTRLHLQLTAAYQLENAELLKRNSWLVDKVNELIEENAKLKADNRISEILNKKKLTP